MCDAAPTPAVPAVTLSELAFVHSISAFEVVGRQILARTISCGLVVI